MKNIIFMGTPDFAAHILTDLIDAGHNIVLVVTQPDKPFGRKKQLKFSDVKTVAIENEIEVFQPENIKLDHQRIIDVKPDLIVTAAYGQIVPKAVLEAPKLLCINVHGSLLPKYRGGAPVHYSVINGDQHTGVTIMEMVSKMDAGDIISQEKFSIDINDTTFDVFEKMKVVASELLLKTINDIYSNSYTKSPQDETLVSYSPNISKDDEFVYFTRDAKAVHNQIRGLVSFPVGHCYINKIRVKIYKSELTEIESTIAGTVYDVTKDAIYINCNDYVIKLIDIQVAGKKRMSIESYLNGNLDIKKGDITDAYNTSN